MTRFATDPAMPAGSSIEPMLTILRHGDALLGRSRMSIAPPNTTDGHDVDSSTEPNDGRAVHRTNLFVSAVLCSDEGSTGAVIRNLSERGALIEGAVLPRPGTRIRLRRGYSEVEGVVVWQKGCRAGLHFKQAIAVDKWLPTAKQAHQVIVDRMIGNLRDSSGQNLPIPDKMEVPGTDGDTIASIIEEVAEKLADDIRIVADHSDSIQRLESVVRHLRRARK